VIAEKMNYMVNKCSGVDRRVDLVQAAPEKIIIQLQTVCERYIMVRWFDSDTEWWFFLFF
jgi:hypothetical protein